MILLPGHAETSRMLRPVIPLLPMKFAIVAPDLADIGDSAISESGIDMLTSTKRVHTPVRSFARRRESASRRARHRVYGSLCLRLPIPCGNQKLALRDDFLPDVPGWEPI